VIAKRLGNDDIFAQLKQKGLESSGVIYCRVVGNIPVADWLDSEHTKTRLNLTRCADLALEHLQRDSDAMLIILCDLFVEGNEPSEGVEWDKATRTKGLVMGIMSHLVVLMRYAPLRDLLFENPDRLMFAVLDEGYITIRSDEAKQMLGFMRRQRAAN
jgi:hypothetical protein